MASECRHNNISFYYRIFMSLPSSLSLSLLFIIVDTSCVTDATRSVYYGDVNHTRTGSTCVAWKDVQLNWTYATPLTFPDKDLASSGNKCRNPDGKPGGPWCYTDTTGSWEYCSIPVCSECLLYPS